MLMEARLERVKSGLCKARAMLTSPGGLLFLFFVCLYSFTYQGRANSFDGQSMFATTTALINHGTLTLSNHAFGVHGRGGLSYSKYGIGQSLAEAPLYLLGKLLGLVARSRAAQVAEAVAMLTNPLLMALCCAVYYAIFRALGYARAVAIPATFVLGVATSLWPYSKSDFSEPLLTLCLAVAVLAALLAASASSTLAQRLRLDALLGVALGIAILTKYAALIYVPIFCLYTLLTLDLTSQPPQQVRSSTSRAPARSWHRWSHWNTWRSRTTWTTLLTRLAVQLAPVFVAGCLVLLVNALRFGAPFITGYDAADHPFNGSLSRGLYGLLLSPYRGLLFYDPLLFVGLLCLPVLLWLRPREALFPLGLFALSLLPYGSYVGWDGGPAWGPRYLVPALPFLLWPVLAVYQLLQQRAAVLVGWHERLTFGALRTGAALLVGVSAGVQLLGVCVNYYVHDKYWMVYQVSFAPLKSVFNASPLAVAWWTLPLSLRYAFTHSFPASGFASSDYPFGPPYPINPHMPADLGAFFAQYFWFTLLPHSALACALGAVLCGVGMLFALHGLRQQMKSEKPLGQPIRLPLP